VQIVVLLRGMAAIMSEGQPELASLLVIWGKHLLDISEETKAERICPSLRISSFPSRAQNF
jgi:hypothetical protein